MEGRNSPDSLHERHEGIPTVGRRDVIDWQRRLADTLAPVAVGIHHLGERTRARAVRDRKPLHGSPHVAATTMGTAKPHPGAGEITQEPV